MNFLGRTRKRRDIARSILRATVAQARDKHFFEHLKVADTFDGRFDLLALHSFLVLERLSGSAADLKQAFIDLLFTHFDEALREQGVGDIGISHRIRKIADAFYGRLAAYKAANSEDDLANALWRNVYREADGAKDAARALARYCERAREMIARCEPESGSIGFPEL